MFGSPRHPIWIATRDWLAVLAVVRLLRPGQFPEFGAWSLKGFFPLFSPLALFILLCVRFLLSTVYSPILLPNTQFFSKMQLKSLLLPALASAAYAESSVTSMFIFGADEQPLAASIVGNVGCLI